MFVSNNMTDYLTLSRSYYDVDDCSPSVGYLTIPHSERSKNVEISLSHLKTSNHIDEVRVEEGMNVSEIQLNGKNSYLYPKHIIVNPDSIDKTTNGDYVDLDISLDIPFRSQNQSLIDFLHFYKIARKLFDIYFFKTCVKYSDDHIVYAVVGLVVAKPGLKIKNMKSKSVSEIHSIEIEFENIS